MGLVVVVAVVSVAVVAADVVLTRRALRKLDTKDAACEPMATLSVFAPADPDEPDTAARVSVSKMLNGGFPATDVPFAPSNADI